MTIEYTEDRSLDTDNTLGGNSPSDYKKPSQKAIKTYVDNGLNAKSNTNHTHSGMLTSSDIATSVDSSSTNAKTVGAKLFYDTCGDIETLINAL